MIIARDPVQRPIDAKLLAIDARGRITHWPRRALPKLLRRGDLVIANDAATLPGSLEGTHVASGRRIEVRLVRRRSLQPDDVQDFAAIVFGEGDYRMPTEDRAAPPQLSRGDVLDLGPLRAKVRSVLGHPRFVAIRFAGTPQTIWRGLATHGKPIQYAYMRRPLKLWDVWTPIAGAAAAFEPPSAGFALDWETLADMRRRGGDFATITHAAGISSTGDEALDALLPFDEPYAIPVSTAAAIERARDRGSRIVAVGTTVVRALEAAAIGNGKVSAGSGVATQRIGPYTRLRVIDAVLSGTHEPGTSHYALLGAFASPATLREADRELEAHGYRTHEYGDSVFVERRDASPVNRSPSAAHTRRSDPIPAA
ncbi:MAG TPA: S-adenosylmethionine:tRNA ribosyltransferase-isomerase [Casimicrobiaceae bacterium]|nr:S-adenosylmethionine:tRNA ribosyltransferase-isomerase [Casimicrobiaceae bacterium]